MVWPGQNNEVSCLYLGGLPLKPLHVIVPLFLVPLIVFCQSDPNSVDGEDPVITGVIARVDADDFPIQLHIQDAILSSGKKYEEIVVAVSRETSIFRDNPDGSMTPGSTTDLVVGALIRARLTGALRKSVPPQVDATRVEVKQSASR